MLQVRVDRHDGVSVRDPETGQQRGLLAEVAGESKSLDPCVLRDKSRTRSNVSSRLPSSTTMISSFMPQVASASHDDADGVGDASALRCAPGRPRSAGLFGARPSSVFMLATVRTASSRSDEPIVRDFHVSVSDQTDPVAVQQLARRRARSAYAIRPPNHGSGRDVDRVLPARRLRRGGTSARRPDPAAGAEGFAPDEGRSEPAACLHAEELAARGRPSATVDASRGSS